MGTQQQPTAIADIVAGDRGDQPVRPGAKLAVAHRFQNTPRQRGAEHRGRHTDGGPHRSDPRGPVPLVATPSRRPKLPPRKKVSISGPETPVMSISPMQIKP